MAKVSIYSVDKKEKKRIEEELFEIISHLRTKREVLDFLMDLFTESETLMLARRIQVAKMILDNYSYDEIKSKMNVGFQTIYRVERWLKVDERRTKFIAEKMGKSRTGKKVENRMPKNGLDKYAHHRLLKKFIE
jgi:TrpR-related protein YerC/YecD